VPTLNRRERDVHPRALVSGTDLAMCVGLPLLAALALVVPERRWSWLCRGIERVRTRAGRAPSALVAGLHLGGFDASDDVVRVRAAQLEHHVQVLRERLTGWDAEIDLEGREHLERARQQGHGAVLWVAHFAFNALAVKIALARAGFDVVHLSRPEHGFSKTRFGIRVLNPIRTGAERRHLAGRIVFDRDAPAASLLEARAALRTHRFVSITAGAWEGQRIATVEAGGLAYDLATGAPRLAALAEAPLLPVIAVRDAHAGAIRVVVLEPVAVSRALGRDDRVIRAAQTYAERVAPWVRSHPYQWREWAKVRAAGRG
jgi:hypothetical protein